MAIKHFEWIECPDCEYRGEEDEFNLRMPTKEAWCPECELAFVVETND